VEIDLAEPFDTVADALGLLIADLGRWLCELEERIERLEAGGAVERSSLLPSEAV
jgi:hypothetical protein